MIPVFVFGSMPSGLSQSEEEADPGFLAEWL